MRSSSLWLAVLCHVALATAYALRTPTFEGPDENSHYEYAWHLANARELPLTTTLATARGLPQTEACVLAHHPPLYYALVGAALAASGRDDTVFGPRVNPGFGAPDQPGRHLKFLHERQPDPLLAWLRLVSVALGALTVLCVHRLGRVCCPDRPAVADLAALLTACLPMWSFLHGVLNSDVLAALLANATVLLLVRALTAERTGTANALGTGVLLGLAWLSKLTTLFLGGLCAVVWLVLLRRARRTGEGRRTLGHALLLAGTAFAISGWWFVRNLSLYGDPLAMSAHDAAFQPIPAELRWHYFFGLAPWPESVPAFLPAVFRSLFGWFGWFSLRPPALLVWTGCAIALLATFGLGRARLGHERACWPRAAWLLAATLVLVFAGTAYFNLSAPQPQARLLFPAVGPAAVLLAAGLVRVAGALPGRRVAALLLPAAGVAMFAMWFAPAFAADLAAAPPDHRSLVGGIVAPSAVTPIEWVTPPPDAPLAAPPTLRWRDPTAPTGTRYSLYAFDERGRVWLATHEWSHGGFVIEGGECNLPDAIWQFLPRGVPVELRLRRVPSDNDERPEGLPASPPWRVVRAD